MPIRRPSSRILPWIGVPVAILAAGVMVSTSSYSAFSATTAPPASSWDAGTVRLTDDSRGTAVFSAGDLAPGEWEERCIVLESTGSLPAEVRLYATGYSTTNGLGQHIEIEVASGSGGGYGSCAGFVPNSVVYRGSLAGLAAAHNGFGSGVGSWQTSGGNEQRVHRITYTLASGTPNTAMGGSADATFAWEAQSR